MILHTTQKLNFKSIRNNSQLMSEAISILIIEDNIIMGMDLQRRLRSLGYDQSILKSNKIDALKFLKIHEVDLVLCDIDLDGAADGIQIAQYVLDQKKAPLIYVTAFADKSTLSNAKTTLPYGYLVKPFSDLDLSSALEIAMYRYDMDNQKQELTHDKLNVMAKDVFTDREFEIVQLMIQGDTNEQIAGKTFISKNTVKFHVSKILDKLAVKNRGEAIGKILKKI